MNTDNIPSPVFIEALRKLNFLTSESPDLLVSETTHQSQLFFIVPPPNIFAIASYNDEGDWVITVDGVVLTLTPIDKHYSLHTTPLPEWLDRL